MRRSGCPNKAYALDYKRRAIASIEVMEPFDPKKVMVERL
jgi:hypothetical protein